MQLMSHLVNWIQAKPKREQKKHERMELILLQHFKENAKNTCVLLRNTFDWMEFGVSESSALKWKKKLSSHLRWHFAQIRYERMSDVDVH